MGVNIVIDNREHVMLEHIRAMLPGIPVQVAPLDVGDVRIEIHGPPDSPPAAIFLFERKSMQDLAASIKDGRYHEQKTRMLSLTIPHRITYLIEGGNGAHGNKHGPSQSSFEGVVYNTMYRDGMHVVITKDTVATSQWIANAFQKFYKNPDKYTEQASAASAANGAHGGIECIKARRQDNITPGVAYRMMLSQIPGISKKISDEIASVYSNMPALIKALQGNEAVKVPMVGKKKLDALRKFLATSVGSPDIKESSE